MTSRSPDVAMAPAPGAAQQAFVARLRQKKAAHSPVTAAMKRPTGVTTTGLTPDAKRRDTDGTG